MIRSSSPVSRAICLVLLVSGCTGTIKDQGSSGADKVPGMIPGQGGPSGAPDNGLLPASQPASPHALHGNVRGVLGCPTEPLPPYGADTAAAPTLSNAFRSSCATCHGGSGQGSAKYPTIPGALTREQYIGKVRTGYLEMPAFAASFITDADLGADFDALVLLKKNPGGVAGAGAAEQNWSEAEVQAAYSKGLQMWRKPGGIDGQACTNCHSADGVELAIIGFKDDSILRRAQQHLSPDDALVVRDFVHAQRRRFGIAEVCSTDWRPFQPGGQVLPGATPEDQDVAFLKELQKRSLKLATGRIETLKDARAALTELQNVDLRQLPIGIPLPRWSEDKFNGPEHRDINDYMAPVPTAPNNPAEYFAQEDEYLQNPTDAGLYRLLDENRQNMNDLGYAKKNSLPSLPGNCSFPNSTAWLIERINTPKRLSVLVAAHLLREEIKNPGSFYHRPPSPFPDAPAATNPAFFLGGFAVEPPCYDANNYPYWIKSFPASFHDEMPESDLQNSVIENSTDRVTHEWMTLGQVLDPSLIATDQMQNNKLHYWAFRNFKQKNVHLPFMYLHRMATQARYWENLPDLKAFPKVSGPFDMARSQAVHPFLATDNQNSAGLDNAVDAEGFGGLGVEVNRFKGNLLRMMLLISRDLLESGMALQQDQDEDHCLSVLCQISATNGYVNDLKMQSTKPSATAAYAAANFDLKLYGDSTGALIADVLALMKQAPRR